MDGGDEYRDGDGVDVGDEDAVDGYCGSFYLSLSLVGSGGAYRTW